MDFRFILVVTGLKTDLIDLYCTKLIIRPTIDGKNAIKTNNPTVSGLEKMNKTKP
jgi:hypothetical protein